MKNIKIENVEYKLPENFNEITIGEFIKLQEIVLKDWSELKKNKETIKLLCDIPDDVINALEYQLIGIIMDSFKFLNEPFNPKALDTDHFIFNGERYEIPQEFARISFGQYVDIDEVLKMNKQDTLKSIPMILAILCLKKGEKYKWDTIKGRLKSFEGLPFELSFRIGQFFFWKEQNYRELTVSYLMAETLMMTQMTLLENLVKSGAGKLYERMWLRLFINRTGKSIREMSMRYSGTLPSKKTNRLWKNIKEGFRKLVRKGQGDTKKLFK